MDINEVVFIADASFFKKYSDAVPRSIKKVNTKNGPLFSKRGVTKESPIIAVHKAAIRPQNSNLLSTKINFDFFASKAKEIKSITLGATDGNK